jgi:hypothetical protein
MANNAEIEITGVKIPKDQPNEEYGITHVRLKNINDLIPIEKIISRIKSSNYNHAYFYTTGDGIKAKVTYGTREGKEYLKTKQDKTIKNNLSELPKIN